MRLSSFKSINVSKRGKYDLTLSTYAIIFYYQITQYIYIYE